MLFRLLILLLSILLTQIIALAVLLSHKVKPVTRVSFFFLCLGLSLWQLNIYIADNTKTNLELLNTILFFWPTVAAMASTIFAFSLEEYPKDKRKFSIKEHSLYFGAVLFLSGVQLITVSSGGIFKNVYIQGDGVVVFERATPYYMYLASLLALLVLQLSRLVYAYKRHADKKQKKAIKAVFATFVATVSFGILTNVVIPIVASSQQLISFGVLSIVIFSFGLAFSILRYRFLNLQPVVARTVSYFLSLGLLVVFYVGLTVFMSMFINEDSTQGLALTVVGLIVVVLAYNPIKKLFDKTTNRIFFRDSYEPQELIDALNQVLVSNVDLEILLSKSADIINQFLKTSVCSFYIRPTSYLPERFIGNAESTDYDEDLSYLHELVPKVRKRVIYVDNFENLHDEKEIVKRLKMRHFEVLARLVNTVDYDVKGVGYILFGAKKTGSAFSKQDLKIIEIIANEMVIAIENVLRYEEIDKFNVTLQQKIDDATKELKRTNEKLRALDEAKDEFVSMASHQLRTPLTSIKGYVSMVAEEDVGKLNEEQKKMLAQALFSSQRMVYLIADLLNVSRLRTGKFVIESKPTYLPTLVESEISQLTEGAAAKDITLRFDKPKKFATLNLDEMKIRQVIMNFTDNAIYYTPSGGKITISLKDKKDSVEFTVRDTGIGVPAHERHKLFTKFYRANNARKARPDGTGLGLFMAKKVVVAQGGSIIFESTEGKGSLFGFSFPKDRLEVLKGA